MNRARQILTYALLILIFGVAVPYLKGLSFLDASLLCAYACLGTVFSGPAAAQAFATPPTSVEDAFRRISAAVAFGEAISLAMLACALGTLYATHSKLLPFPPDLLGLAWPEALGLGLTLAIASMAGWFALRFSADSAKRALRLSFLGLLVAYFFRGNWLPEVLPQGTAVTMAAALLFLILIARHMRTQLPRPA